MLTKKEFIAMYPGVDAAYHTKSWKTVVMLDKAGLLSIYAYCEAMIKETDISRFSGRSKFTLTGWKRDDPFVYDAVREKCISCLVAEFEK